MAKSKTRKDATFRSGTDAKSAALDVMTVVDDDATLTTNQGLAVADDQNQLKAGVRGPSLLEDFQLREKIMHFDHERIPERVVHARGVAAHGVFELYESMGKYTRAKFLTDTSRKTPVFVRFSTVAGSRGSTDLARDVRGFAIKFYTDEGNFDLVGNNMPIFFIQDAMKFPDLIHAVKGEPHNEIPQAASAHDTFWDFISLSPESAHMILWAMSDRAIPRSLRMMEGFGIHTFRFVDEAGKSCFVKFHWKPLLGMHSVMWDEAQQISGKDSDFHRRDMWQAIEKGAFPEWEFGVQIVDEKDEHKFDFDLLDPTKLIPEEMVPVQRIGKMTLNRNPDNFFAETEQVAFHPGHLVSGIDFSDDPLLQGRLFSYLDTQITRLGGPNFHEIPINRPLAPVHNNQRDGHMRQTINRGHASYQPNSIGGGCPFQVGPAMGGFVSYAEKIDAVKVRGRGEKFFDHFSQAAMFYRSQSAPEQNHIVKAFRFELGKCDSEEIRVRMVGVLSRIDASLAARVASGLGIGVPDTSNTQMNFVVPADAPTGSYESRPLAKKIPISPALSMANTIGGIATRNVAILAADGVDSDAVAAVKRALEAGGGEGVLIGPRLGNIKDANGKVLKIDMPLSGVASVLFDAVYVPGGDASVAALGEDPDALRFVEDTFKHCKAIGLDTAALAWAARSATPLGAVARQIGNGKAPAGFAVRGKDTAQAFANRLVEVVGAPRAWEREPIAQ